MEQETQTMNEKTGMSKKAKVLVGILVAIMGFSAWTWWFYVLHAPERDVQKFFTFWQWRLHSYGLKMAYESDVYGGETPEETVRLYVEALRAEDFALASKYYVPQDQMYKLSELKAGSRGIDFGKYIEFIEGFASRGIRTSEMPTEIFLVYTPEGFESAATMMFKKNPATGKWKIEEE
ncbi:MAG TPA: hypothetical protein VLB83_01930 [Candidatus Paceibacterota bacterium]|nr:hypothetical protein [Candidatus Paceibacterota bacterium]